MVISFRLGRFLPFVLHFAFSVSGRPSLSLCRSLTLFCVWFYERERESESCTRYCSMFRAVVVHERKSTRWNKAILIGKIHPLIDSFARLLDNIIYFYWANKHLHACTWNLTAQQNATNTNNNNSTHTRRTLKTNRHWNSHGRCYCICVFVRYPVRDIRSKIQKLAIRFGQSVSQSVSASV